MVSSSFRIRRCCKKPKGSLNLKDRISELPENILGHILSLMPTTDAIRTSVLSKQWRNVWNSVLAFDIEDWWTNREGSSFDLEAQFMGFVDKVLFGRLSEVSLRIFRVKLYKNHNMSLVREWINVVNRLSDLEELELLVDSSFELPPCIFSMKNLVSLNLTLSNNVLISSPLSSVFLPNLKTLELHLNRSLGIDSVHNFLIGCPLLEVCSLDRTLDNMNNKTLYIKSSTMKSFKLVDGDFPLSRIVIDASNLENLDLKIPVCVHVELSTKPSFLVKLKLDIDNGGTSNPAEIKNIINFFDFFRKISNTTTFMLLSSLAMLIFRKLESSQKRGECLNGF